ncbi:hypothetical protein MJL81_30430, partial [Salmonella enterica subsp. enterica serovar Anatum]|nr:hypothetical protein [Salmonella enterica subsp. enterica serovar Anatum]
MCFNDSTIINHMFICKTRRNRLIKIVLEGFLPNNRVITSGKVLAEGNADEKLDPASLTKIMTSYVVGQALKAGKIKLTD